MRNCFAQGQSQNSLNTGLLNSSRKIKTAVFSDITAMYVTDLVDNLAQDEVPVLWTVPFNGGHEQIAEAIDSVWQLVQQMETAWQHCVSEGMELSTVQGLSLQKTL